MGSTHGLWTGGEGRGRRGMRYEEEGKEVGNMKCYRMGRGDGRIEEWEVLGM